jgi:hypothetical protein
MSLHDAALRYAHGGDGSQRRRTGGRTIGSPASRSRSLAIAAVMVVVLSVLTACVDDSNGPQFANDLRTPASTVPASLATPDLTLMPTPPPQASPVSAAELLRARGAPSRIYFLRGSELWTLSLADKSANRVIAPEGGRAIVAFDASPSGDKAAVAFGAPDGGPAASLAVVDAAGKTLQRFDDLGQALKATVSTPASVDWSPQGAAILIGFRDGGIASIPVGDGAPKLLLAPNVARHPEAAAWSPTGQDFAFLDRTGADQPLALYRASVAAGASAPKIVAPSGDSAASIQRFAWLPDGRSLLFTQEGGALGSGSTDLWQVGADGAGRKLVASAGVAAPVAQINQFAPSTDGRSVAYAIDVPTAGGPKFDSLWLRELDSGRPIQAPMPSGISVVRMWWTSAGLVVEATIRPTPGTPVASQAGTTVLLLAPPVGRVEELLRFGTHPAATPVAATPIAATPGAATP